MSECFFFFLFKHKSLAAVNVYQPFIYKKNADNERRTIHTNGCGVLSKKEKEEKNPRKQWKPQSYVCTKKERKKEFLYEN